MEGTRVYDPNAVVDDESKRQVDKGPNAHNRTERERSQKRHWKWKLCEVDNAARAVNWPVGLGPFQMQVNSYQTRMTAGADGVIIRIVPT